MRILSIAFAALTLLPGPVTAANRRQSVEALTGESDKIVLGAVVSRTSRWAANDMIFTDIVVAPEVTLKGEHQTSLVVRVAGGSIGRTQVTVSDSPEMLDGERVLLFLKQETGHYDVAGRDSGKYAAGSAEAADAVERALRSLEETAGRRLDFERELAAPYLAHARDDRSTGTTGPTSCYLAPGSKWPDNLATYSIGTGIPADWVPSIIASTAAWNNSGAAFSFRNDPGSINAVSLADLVAEYGSTYAKTYAVAITWSDLSVNTIVRAAIQANSRFVWSTSGQPNAADVQNILTHEFGHWLRLADIYGPSTCSAVTMWGTSPFGEISKRSLEQPDIDGIISIYGRSITPAAFGGPALVSPGNGATDLGSSVTLLWAPVSGATAYDVYFGTTSNPPLVATTVGTGYTLPAPGSSVIYFWRVVARNSASSGSSATWSFTTAGERLRRQL